LSFTGLRPPVEPMECMVRLVVIAISVSEPHCYGFCSEFLEPKSSYYNIDLIRLVLRKKRKPTTGIENGTSEID
jgi:hypothetical protein